MSELAAFRDHAQARATWQPGRPSHTCTDGYLGGVHRPAQHNECRGCGCECHRPTDADRLTWQRLADEATAHLNRAADDQDQHQADQHDPQQLFTTKHHPEEDPRP